MAGSTAYNLNHMQVGLTGATPTYRDINYSVTADFQIDQSSETFAADGEIVESTFGPREGTGTISFGSIDMQTVALMTGDTFVTDGVLDTDLLERVEFRGDTVPPSVILAGWVKNVSSRSPFAGTVLIVPNAKVSVPNASFEQASWSELEADITFNPDENGVMLIWENREVAPTFAAGVMPVELVVVPGP